ncbi:24969_t:CDS:2 [Dentiscutata erythropus]|uniref:24969_t:CDS:1 n=1 Tax=Dentiscutata erythropus TaxID=1348616 RepID=A0A9N8VGV9_9GLOM|nr:24969_t:CDS:2 [Dentiscutata erythropus]
MIKQKTTQKKVITKKPKPVKLKENNTTILVKKNCNNTCWYCYTKEPGVCNSSCTCCFQSTNQNYFTVECGIKTYKKEQTQYNSFINRRRNRANIDTPAVISDGYNTLLFWPQQYYLSQLLFKDILFNNNTCTKHILDFYQIFKLTIFGHVNDSIQSLTVEEGNVKNKYVFPLAEGQGEQDTNDVYIINLIRKSFRVRLLILKQDNTCQLTQDEGIGQNASLLSSAVFENLSNLIDSCCIEKNWCITAFNNDNTNNRPTLIQINTGLLLTDTDKPTQPTPTRPFEDSNTPTPTTTILTPTTTNLSTTTTITTPTPTITTLTPTITIPTPTITTPTPTISLPTTTTTITFPKPYTNIDITTTKTTKTTTVLQTILKPVSKTTTTINTTTTIPKPEQFNNLISCSIRKDEFKESEIKTHLKNHIKNYLPKDTICDKLNLKKQSTVYNKMREIINKLTDIQVKDLVDKIQKLIEQYDFLIYPFSFINFIYNYCIYSLLIKIMSSSTISNKINEITNENNDLKNENNNLKNDIEGLSEENNNFKNNIEDLQRRLLEYQNYKKILAH